MCCELTVTCKDSERTTKHKFLVYEQFQLSQDDPIIMRCIHEAVQKFNGEPDSVKIRCMMIVQ